MPTPLTPYMELCVSRLSIILFYEMFIVFYTVKTVYILCIYDFFNILLSF
jgi:hypothetical protein